MTSTDSPEATPYDHMGKSVATLLTFFDDSVQDIYTYILHRTRIPEIASDLTLEVYFTLMKKRRSFWWKSIANFSTIIKYADKAIASVRKWEEEATGYTYVEEILKCVPRGHDPKTKEMVRPIIHAIKGMPIRQQRLAVLTLFLHMPSEKISEALQKDIETVKKESESLKQALVEKIQSDPSFESHNPQEFINALSCPDLTESETTNLRTALIERYSHLQSSSLRYIMPAASFMLLMSTFTGTVLIVSAFTLPTMSVKADLQQIAAVNVMNYQSELHLIDEARNVEKSLKGIASHYAHEELTDIGLDLSTYAVLAHLEEERILDQIIDTLSEEEIALLLQFVQIAEAKENDR